MIQHIAFIMDGNGRWAEMRRKPRKNGHKAGTKALERTIENCESLGVKFVTFYAFSTENWSRPKAEIDYLFNTFRTFLKEIDKYASRNYRVRFIGNLHGLPSDIEEGCLRVMRETEKNDGICVVIAMNYGSWEEITSAVNRLIAKGKSPVTEEEIAAELYTDGIPFPDLVIRTGGEVRLSNFLLLQSSYAELLFIDTLWPDFDKEALLNAIRAYESRTRKFGGLGEKNA